jgi:CheY-like chemotaxis protein
MIEAASRKRILVIEDNPADIELLQLALDDARLQYVLIVIDDGAEALRFFRQEGKYANSAVPDLAILDLNLPKHDGIEIMAAVRANSAFAELPVAVLSSSSSPRDRSKLLSFGRVRYFTKPTDLEQYGELAQTIRGLLDPTSVQI